MIEMFVSTVGLDPSSGQAMVVLDESTHEKILPIWIGLAEANAINRAMARISSDRPMTHELLYSIIVKLGYSVEKVEITEIKDDAFIATVQVAREEAPDGDGSLSEGREFRKVIDARPSDAIAIALISKAPILVSGMVLERAALPTSALRRRTAADSVADEAFKQFIQDVKASDFKLPGESP